MGLDLSTLTPAEAKDLVRLIQQSQLQAVQDTLDKEQGAQLHHEKNAPWAPGGYYEKALKDVPPYQYREYPKMLYSAAYNDAVREFQQAQRYRERKDEPGTRDELIKLAERHKTEACRTVENSADERACVQTGLWATTPDGAVEAQERLAQAVAKAAAEAAGADRRMSDAAKAERDAVDAASEGHLVEVPAKPRNKGGRPRKVPESVP